MGLLRALREELDVASFTQGHDGLLPVAALGEALAHALLLAALNEGVHPRDLHVEQAFDGVLDFQLVRAEGDLEHDLVAVDLEPSGLLRQRDGPADDLFRGEDHDFTAWQRASRALAASFDTT